jgi:hypothetical protein
MTFPIFTGKSELETETIATDHLYSSDWIAAQNIFSRCAELSIWKVSPLLPESEKVDDNPCEPPILKIVIQETTTQIDYDGQHRLTVLVKGGDFDW